MKFVDEVMESLKASQPIDEILDEADKENRFNEQRQYNLKFIIYIARGIICLVLIAGIGGGV